jgi:hypothetical protein
VPVEEDDDDEGYEVEELVVTAARALRGSVVGDAIPEITLDQREIRALGVSSVDELLAALEPQLASGRGRGGGRPVTLVNGMRVSSYSEIRDLPPEAIARMEVLPEEVALRYGYRADQRVVNFVLRRRFQALTVEGGVNLATAGGRGAIDAEANVLRLQRDTRTQITVKAGRSSALLESERDVLRADVQNGALRTLLPQTENVSVNGVIARPFGEGMSGSLNGRLETSGSAGRLGPSGDPFVAVGVLDPLRRLTDANSAHLGGGVNGAVSGWRWSVTANADRSQARTITEAGYDPVIAAFRPPGVSRSTVTSGEIEALVNGSLFRLPAGAVNAAVTIGADTLDLSGESLRLGVFRETDLDRQSARAQVNLDAPLASRTGGVGGIGSLSVNLNAEVRELSDFGTLTTVGGGVTWSPIEMVRLIASFTQEDGAPTIQQLGDPETVTPGVRVFDFTRGETVELTRIEGGNRSLVADSRRVVKLGLTLRPLDETDLVLRADYTRSRLSDEIANFPAATPEVEAAFPGRFIRDASGRLIQVDVRPVNFASHDRDELRWGFNYSRPLRNNRTPSADAGEGRPARDAVGAGERPFRGGGGGGGRAGGRGFGGGRGAGGGNLQFAVFHTWRLQDEVLVRPGVPVLDLLEGAGGSLTPKHQVDVQAGASRNGLGGRLTARWQQGGRIDSAFGASGLNFSDLTTVNLRLFADLGARPQARRHPWMRGARLSLSVDNLFDERVDVRDAAGTVPINFQPDLVDPLGRTVRLSVRKVFLPPRAVRPPEARPRS